MSNEGTVGSDETSWPSSICVRVTRRCNAGCDFCQAPDTSVDRLTVPEIVEIGRTLRAMGVSSVKLSGGEPTLRRDLATIITELAMCGLRSVVITNGIRLEDDVLSALLSENGEIKFSVHFPDARNDGVLGRESFDKVCSNIQKSVRKGLRVGINTVLTPANERCIEDMIRFAGTMDVAKISFIPVVPRGRALPIVEYDLTDKQVDRLRSVVSAHAKSRRPIVRLIDIRTTEYWIVENDGSLWIEMHREAQDRLLRTKEQLLGG